MQEEFHAKKSPRKYRGKAWILTIESQNDCDWLSQLRAVFLHFFQNASARETQASRRASLAG